MAQSQDDELAARLSQVNDDLTPRQECVEWLIAEMREGRDPDALLAELVAIGWSQDDAEPLVEQARHKTRSTLSLLRTRDAVARAVSSRPVPTINPITLATRAIIREIGAEAHEVRQRIARGLCHKCGYDLMSSTDKCLQCGSPIVRRRI